MAEKLFAEFTPTHRTDWERRLEKELKGKSPDSLDWQLEESVRLAAYYTAEDLEGTGSRPFLSGRNSNAWEIGEIIEVSDMAEANHQALEALAGGANAPLFQLRHHPSLEELNVLLDGMHPGQLSAHFAPQHPGKDPAELYLSLIRFIRGRHFHPSTIAGSIDFDPLLDWSDPPFEPLRRVLKFAGRQMPRFKVLQVNGRNLHTGIENTSRELALIVAKGVEYLAQMEDLGVPPRITNAHMQFSLTISLSYFVEIAKLRALRLMWANVLKAYGQESASIPPLVVHFTPESQDKDINRNMIRAATQAMAAVIGGADRLYVLHANYALQEPSTHFTRRIARNVQHLLRLESHLGHVIDPAAGSYYIETLTAKLAEEAWLELQKIEKQGGFLEAGDL